MPDAAIGRKSELAQTSAFLDSVPGGARVLVLEGELGMGKTTLWLAGLEMAAERAWRVLTARPSEAEATFAYAGLCDLFSTTDDDSLGVLPSPQRRALRVALLREEPDGSMADQGAVAIALLNLLRSLADAGPVLVAIDDIQWLDSPSTIALSYAVRRLGREQIGILLARRTESAAGRDHSVDRLLGDRAVHRVAVGPLSVASVGQLLHSELSVAFPPTTLRRIHATSGGNPLFALELGRALGTEPVSLESGTDLPVPDELLALLGARVEHLPAPTREALAVTAAATSPTVQILAQTIDDPIDEALEPAIDARIVSVTGSRIRFSHPLWAVAARSGISSARRRGIHARLGEIVADPEERARHLALAAEGPDEDTAAALEAVARRAFDRGAPPAAAELAALAWELTPAADHESIRRRRLDEAMYATRSDDPLRARDIVSELLASWPAGLARGPALVTLAHAEYLLDVRRSVAILREAITEAGDDERLRMRCEASLTGALDVLGQDVADALAHGRAELAIAERLGDDAHIATSLRGIARNEQRRSGQMPLEVIERSLALEPRVQADTRHTVAEWPSWCWAEMLSWTDDLRGGLAVWATLREVAIERGDQFAQRALSEMIPYACVAGDWEEAILHAHECIELASGMESHYSAMALAARALAEAHLGDEDSTRRDAEEAIRLAARLGALNAGRHAAWALGHLELSLDDPARAHDQLGPLVENRRMAGVREPGDMRHVIDEIEALIGLGDLNAAEALLGWFESLAQSSGRVFAMAACQRARGLLLAARSEVETALEALEASRESYATIDDRFGGGRTLLALGSVQRRARQRRASRASLDEALAIFEDLGAKLWAERVRQELGRIGGRAPSSDALTPSERRVAELVAEGHTNREVAALLFVQERTVEGHLSNVYAKLGIRSRTELARRLAAESQLRA